MPRFYGTYSSRYSNHYSPNRGAGYGSPKIMQAKFAGRCADCGMAIAAGQTIRYHNGKAMHVTSLACDEAKAAQPQPVAPLAGSAFRGPQQAATPATIDLTPLRTFIQAAKDRGLKYPKLRVLDADGRTELALGLTVTGHNPGSVSVKRAGEYVGLIRQDGSTKGAITPALAARLLAVAAAPAEAAKAYAVLMCRCSFCELPLTDAGSVEVGYGPVCAKHWGLPHAPKGTKAPVAVAAMREPTTEEFLAQGRAVAAMLAEADEREMQRLEAEADREGTARDEANKWAARAAMELA